MVQFFKSIKILGGCDTYWTYLLFI